MIPNKYIITNFQMVESSPYTNPPNMLNAFFFAMAHILP